ncbi:hypothetical protein ACJX0J_041785, partial [Zea mays]
GLVYGLLSSFNVNSKPFFAVEEQRQLLDCNMLIKSPEDQVIITFHHCSVQISNQRICFKSIP